mmetsp:Transcript_30995/g.23048  ORF Transcript_30995/g.23048 Transcript_30995/m.23048 type:complete len:166 (+) Transcript_30995:46-543(+)|eukprot:CAMPEP_0202962182 /NCGR_PEP_ID=MMETSP1396-20130829/6284_1 /ASSEMBLY_ACC=CAM_ASM_000872 /TAXON_ID= /ORGANISM="Pseudokeronopsis sp., Strain Brazil" /LENGTH=165 /DNA_ID=CAMNT_0049682581 /DNA_START=32 /DNA_END=529 /DNA_ORIENTATION=+
MALSRIHKYNWDRVLSKLANAEQQRPILLIRGAVNELLGEVAKYPSKPAEINFADHKKKLKLTASAVDKLEALYKKRELPNYYSQIDEFYVLQRQLLTQVRERIVEARKLDIEELTAVKAELETFKVTEETTVKDMFDRFPEMAREIEQQVKNHQWAGVKEEKAV